MTKCLRSTIENMKQLLRNCRFGATAARVLRTACWVLLTACSSHTDFNSWKMYGGNAQNNHYSSLSQIDTNNVTQLKVAWTYHTGDMDTANHSQIQCNPIIVDGVLYGTSPLMKLFAIDAATGKPGGAFFGNAPCFGSKWGLGYLAQGGILPGGTSQMCCGAQPFGFPYGESWLRVTGDHQRILPQRAPRSSAHIPDTGVAGCPRRFSAGIPASPAKLVSPA